MKEQIKKKKRRFILTTVLGGEKTKTLYFHDHFRGWVNKTLSFRPCERTNKKLYFHNQRFLGGEKIKRYFSKTTLEGG